ncbi:MAG: hypothetical protein IKG87_01790 [Clostridia bacterium]|nr:hypothetical protein [Clostridia bacterium]MBR4576527.1 hypothetical protein [Clostridia bacterium]
MNCSRNAKSETIFSNDFALEKFAEQLVSGWVLSKDKPVTRKEFREWLKTFNILLNSTADEYFKRVEIIKNKGVNE